MADRSFEEQVREEMAGLLIRPGAAVWEKLEADLTRKKKRRGLLWFVFTGLGILLLTAVGYSLREGKVVEKAPLASSFSGKGSASSKEERMAATPANKVGKIITDKEKNEQPVILQRQERAAIEKSTIGKTVIEKTVILAKMGKKPIPGSADAAGKSSEETFTHNAAADVDRMVRNADSMTVVTDFRTPGHNDELWDSIIVPAAKTVLTSDTADKVMPAPAKDKVAGKKRLQLSLAVTAGVSGMRKLPGQTLVYQSSISTPSTGGFPGGNNTYKVPSLQDAGSYGISLLADKQLSKRYGLGISLGYETYRTKTGVGRRVDSSLQTSFFSSASDQGFYYISTDSVPYTNRFHFAQAAVSGYALYAIGKSLQLRWELGLGLSALLRSNALHYDQARGVLFTNSSLLRTFQWNLSTGFEVGFGKKPFLFLGPQINWYIQSPFTDQGSDDQHLFRSALRARMVVGKKRK